MTNLRVRTVAAPSQVLVENLSLDLTRGQTIGIVGESGSGKSVSATAMVRALPPELTSEGTVHFDGADLSTLGTRELRRFRRDNIGFVFQDPISVLDPRLSVGTQLRRAIRLRFPAVSRAEASARAESMLERVGIAHARDRLDAFAHQLSGGMGQRVVIALALAREPRLLIADEPTTALDATVQKQVLDLIDSVRDELGLAVLLISHDLPLVAERAGEVIVMREGRVVETGAAERVLVAPRSDYARELVSLVPSLSGSNSEAQVAVHPAHPAQPAAADERLLRIENVSKEFVLGSAASGARRFPALTDVSIHLDAGEILGIVGESGSGKSTLARIAAGLASADTGRVLLEGRQIGERQLRRDRDARRAVQYVFQDPLGSLSPRLTVGDSVAEALRAFRIVPAPLIKERVRSLFDDVGLSKALVDRRPHELSGGQRQRVAIARALAAEPRVLIADEPVSALDVSVQARILDLLRRLRVQRGLSLILISHDIAVVGTMADRITVMRAGEVVESASRNEVLLSPRHAYTRQLLAAMPGMRTAPAVPELA